MINDNKSFTDLCAENIENMLEKSDIQETLDILVENSRINTDEGNRELCSIYRCTLMKVKRYTKFFFLLYFYFSLIYFA